MTRKILYSPGFGAGWTTWHYGSKEEKQFMLTYQPFIDALERGERISPALEEQFSKDYAEKFSSSTKGEPYTGGLRDLKVYEARGLVHINEYDGSESVIEQGFFEEDYWF